MLVSVVVVGGGWVVVGSVAVGVRQVVALGMMLEVYRWEACRWENRFPMRSGWLGRLGWVWRVRKGLHMCL